MKLKVLHLNYNDRKGGAAVAVNRIHECLKKEGVVSKVLVAKKTDDDDDFIGPSSTFEEIKWKLLLSINRKFEQLEKKTKYDSNSYNLIPNNVVKKINNLIYNKKLRDKLSEAGKKMIDGKGSRRIINQITKNYTIR